MHELSVVFRVVELVEEAAKANKVNHVNAVTISLGEVSMVIPAQLIDCWNWVRNSKMEDKETYKHPLLTDCKLKIEKIPAITYCEDCKQEYSTIEFGKTCPHCGSEHTYLKQGNEFSIKQIEVI